MAAVDIALALATRFGELLAAPLKNFDMLWIMIFIYFNWILTDYFQERKGTDLGNAFVNGFTGLWVGIDWIRQLTKTGLTFEFSVIAKILICIFFMSYGLLIMVEAARAKKIAHYVGRIREVSYFMIVLTPIFYGAVAIDLITVGTIFLFLPVFYIIGEAIDRALPAPKTEEESLGAAPSLDQSMTLPPAAGPELGLLPPTGGFPPM